MGLAIRERMTGAERRQHILEAAAAVFAARGYEGARMEDVAEAAGVTKPLLYKHFPSKDALFEAYVERERSRFIAELREATLESDHPPDTLRRTLAIWLGRLSDPSTLRFVDPGTHTAYDDARQLVHDHLAKMIAEVDPSIRTRPARLIAAALQGAAESAGLEWAKRPRGLSLDEAVDLLSTFCWEGLKGLRSLIDHAAARSPNRRKRPKRARRTGTR